MKKTANDEMRRWLTTRQAEDYAQLERRSLNRLASENKIFRCQSGNKFLFDKESIDRYYSKSRI